MDAETYWAIAERDIEIQNPVTDRKLRLLEIIATSMTA